MVLVFRRRPCVVDPLESRLYDAGRDEDAVLPASPNV